MLRFIFLFSLFLFRLNAYELSVCAIFQNEAQFLDEWLGFHFKICSRSQKEEA